MYVMYLEVVNMIKKVAVGIIIKDDSTFIVIKAKGDTKDQVIDEAIKRTRKIMKIMPSEIWTSESMSEIYNVCLDISLSNESVCIRCATEGSRLETCKLCHRIGMLDIKG